MRRSAILAIAFTIGIGFAALRNYPSTQGAQDVNVYKDIAVSLKTGGPISPETGRYPPLASSLFLLLSSGRIGLNFAAQWTIFLIAAVAAAAMYQGLVIRNDAFHWLPAAVFATIFVLHPELLFARYDLLIGILIYLTWTAHAADRTADSGAFLTLASALKIVPILALPLLWLSTPRAVRGRLLTGIGAGLAIAALVPLLALGPGAALANLKGLWTYQGNRGVQVETTWSGLDMLWQMSRGRRALLDVRAQSWDNADLGSSVSVVASLLVVAGAAALAADGWLHAKASRQSIGPMLLALLAWTLATTPVFSPQYVVWIMPSLLLLRPWTSLQTYADPHAVKIAVCIWIVGMATQWIYPLHYGEFLSQTSPVHPLVVTIRNAALFVLVTLLRAPQAVEGLTMERTTVV